MKIENTKIYGLEESIKASKYPMAVYTELCTTEMTDRVKELARAEIGSGHDNFLNGIIVQFDLTFSNKAWVEMQRYHFMDFVSSQSTMHRISKMDVKKQCNKYVTNNTREELERLKNQYNSTKDKEDYLTLLYNIPSGFELTARMATNYRQLKTIYKQRKNHRLPEWRQFCNWIETLPNAEYLICCDPIR